MPTPIYSVEFAEYPAPARIWEAGSGRSTTTLTVYEQGEPIGHLLLHHDYQTFLQQAATVGEWLVVGYEQHYYLLHPATGRTHARPLDLYFGYLYPAGDNLLVCSASEVVCLNSDGQEAWRTPDLGFDGILLDDITADTISGRGEWDPPGGWEPFQLSRSTGRLLSPPSKWAPLPGGYSGPP